MKDIVNTKKRLMTGQRSRGVSMNNKRLTREGYRDHKIPGPGGWGGNSNENRIYGHLTEGWGDISDDRPMIKKVIDFLINLTHNTILDVRSYRDKRPIA